MTDSLEIIGAVTHRTVNGIPVVNCPAVHHTWVLVYRGSSGYTRIAISHGTKQMSRKLNCNFLSHGV